MKAMLVAVSLLTRVVVPDDATDEQIVETAKANFRIKVEDELMENLEYIDEDEEYPYETQV